MIPRKRQRPNPAEPQTASAAVSRVNATSQATASQSTSTSASTSRTRTSGQEPGSSHIPPPPPVPASTSQLGGASTGTSAKGNHQDLRKAKSWYGYGSLQRPPKATASISVAKENILGDTIKFGKPSDLGRFDSKRVSDTASISSAANTASSVPKVPDNVANESKGDVNKPRAEGPERKEDDSRMDIDKQEEANVTNTDTGADTGAEKKPAQPTTPQRPSTSSAWLGWLSRTPFTETSATMPPPSDNGSKPPNEDPLTPRMPSNGGALPASTSTTEPPPASKHAPGPPASTSWFGFWPSTASTTPDPKSAVNSQLGGAAGESQDVVMADAPPAATDLKTPKPEPAPTAGSTWAFWSKDSPKPTGKTTVPETGEIAVMGEGSEKHPKPMAEGTMSDAPSKNGKTAAKAKDIPPGGKSTWRKNKRLRPPSMDAEPQSPSPAGSLSSATEQDAANFTSKQIQPSEPATKRDTKVDSSAKSITDSESSIKLPPNLLLPSFSSTYQMKDNPSILQQLTQLFTRTQRPSNSHVLRLKEVPRIRKAIAIGVHGLFPATYLRPMIGQPTGTSLRFASLCADAIRRWAEAHGCGDCDIEKVALEGDGKINDRVDNLWKLMLNWIDHIRRADLIIIACHSQGVPVSIMLLEKLIDLGIITDAKIGVCAMAGVALGPFADYKSSILMGSAAELWDFGNPESNNSLRFEAAMKRVLDYGARITFIGSIDDQLVPLESAVYSPAEHPYIYRAVFIDGRIHAPDFIAHLVGFALKLRNLGVSDHGLIRELSAPLAGSLYSGEGHSRLYYDDAVYDLAISHALETTPADAHGNPPCEIRRRDTMSGSSSSSSSLGAASNPYVLPWIMRGLLEEDFVKTELSSETEELLKKFDAWKPSNKALKDVKYRLEAVRSKL